MKKFNDEFNDTLDTLQTRSHNQCELCSAKGDLSIYEVQPATDDDKNPERALYLCANCLVGTKEPGSNPKHWHCLRESMWSETPAVKVMTWRILNALNAEGWAQDLLSEMYLNDEQLKWAEMGLTTDAGMSDSSSTTRDSNGTPLTDGDSVTLIKDLEVKGAGFTAKRGTLVKNIVLTSNPEHIEGRVNGTQIVLLTKFLKKA